jgi:methyltransferase
VSHAALLLGVVTLQRAGELVIARANTRALLARGAVEVAPSHYPLIVAVHGAWLAALWAFGRDQPVNLALLCGFLLLEAARVWVMRTLGPRWTTRIIVLPGAPLVARGPYRYLSHPNYVVVAGEIALLPLVLGLPWIAAAFTLLNAAVLAVRIRAEHGALATARAATARQAP